MLRTWLNTNVGKGILSFLKCKIKSMKESKFGYTKITKYIHMITYINRHLIPITRKPRDV